MERDRYEDQDRASQASQIRYLAVQTERLADLVDKVMERLTKLENSKIAQEAVESDRERNRKLTDRVRLMYYGGLIAIGSWIFERILQSLVSMAAKK